MAKIRLTKEFNFEMAHALWNYDGLCKNIHGHSYKLFVTVIGEPISDIANPKLGMVIDFGDLKKIVKDEIIDKYDHTIVLNKEAPVEKLIQFEQMFERHDFIDYQPTCENIIIDYAKKIKKKLPKNITLHKLKLYETSTSYAEWFASDNE
ncbi:MAG: 6-carboxytetrahydropterin synthase [Bacteroidales bacterium]|nr:6-carboxytetrahydropterin synthase [Bacteroidales bacterium]